MQPHENAYKGSRYTALYSVKNRNEVLTYVRILGILITEQLPVSQSSARRFVAT